MRSVPDAATPLRLNAASKNSFALRIKCNSGGGYTDALQGLQAIPYTGPKYSITSGRSGLFTRTNRVSQRLHALAPASNSFTDSFFFFRLSTARSCCANHSSIALIAGSACSYAATIARELSNSTPFPDCRIA